jgi:hypothetical protein
MRIDVRSANSRRGHSRRSIVMGQNVSLSVSKEPQQTFPLPAEPLVMLGLCTEYDAARLLA